MKIDLLRATNYGRFTPVQDLVGLEQTRPGKLDHLAAERGVQFKHGGWNSLLKIEIAVFNRLVPELRRLCQLDDQWIQVNG